METYEDGLYELSTYLTICIRDTLSDLAKMNRRGWFKDSQYPFPCDKKYYNECIDYLKSDNIRNICLCYNVNPEYFIMFARTNKKIISGSKDPMAYVRNRSENAVNDFHHMTKIGSKKRFKKWFSA